MKSNITNSKNIKIRVTPQQHHYIETVAKENNTTLSEVIRHSLFSESTSNDYAIKIHRVLVKNELQNLITALSIPSTIKELILKELNKIE